MSASNWYDSVSAEAIRLFGLLSVWNISVFVGLAVSAVLLGRVVRAGVYTLWRLGLDPERRLAPVGTVLQLLLTLAIGLGTLGVFVRTAPVATFVLSLAVSPILVLLLHRPLGNAVAGLTVLFRRSFVEGDHIVLPDGKRGVVRQVRLTTTLARTDSGGRLVIPNSAVLSQVLEVERRQGGVPLVLRFPVPCRPGEAVLGQVKRVGILSPHRAADSVVLVDYVEAASELEVSLRVPRDAAEPSARRELEAKIAAVVNQAEPDATTVSQK